MTVVEAQERLEALTQKLGTSKLSLAQRRHFEAQMVRCHRIIQRSRQKAHQSLASFGQTLLNMSSDTIFDQNQHSALITAAHLIRAASIEQLAVAVPAAIRETSNHSTRPAGIKFPEFKKIAACLLNLANITLPCERNIAIRTALQLSNIVERPQIHQSVRRAQARVSELGPKGVMNRFREIYFASRPRKHRPSQHRADSKKAISLSAASTARGLR